MMTIRLATEDDKPRLIEMATRFLLESQYGELFDNAATPLSIGELVTNTLALGAIFLAEIDPRGEDLPRWHERDTCKICAVKLVVGMLAIVALPHPLTGVPIAEEIAWWVEPEHRNSTIGPKLLRSAEQWATTNGANVVKMVAPAGSTVGEFYERLGYRPVETAYIKRV